MKKWYKEPYFNSKEWLLSNLEYLNLSNDELVFLLLIIFANENKIIISNDFFVNKMHLDNKKIDEIISRLVNKNYLKIELKNNKIMFNIDGIYNMDPSDFKAIDNNDVFDIVTEIFNRPLNSLELQKITDLVDTYGLDRFDHALRIAESYNKLNLNYIETILKNENNSSRNN